eukprot:5720322-Amphidinium_carterae.1
MQCINLGGQLAATIVRLARFACIQAAINEWLSNAWLLIYIRHVATGRTWMRFPDTSRGMETAGCKPIWRWK